MTGATIDNERRKFLLRGTSSLAVGAAALTAMPFLASWLGADLDAGFYCPCHGSRFDLAGRVVKGSPAPTNLPVPAYHLADERTLVIGSESDAPG